MGLQFLQQKNGCEDVNPYYHGTLGMKQFFRMKNCSLCSIMSISKMIDCGAILLLQLHRTKDTLLSNIITQMYYFLKDRKLESMALVSSSKRSAQSESQFDKELPHLRELDVTNASKFFAISLKLALLILIAV